MQFIVFFKTNNNILTKEPIQEQRTPLLTFFYGHNLSMFFEDTLYTKATKQYTSFLVFYEMYTLYKHTSSRKIALWVDD